jgi:hypothetical protein
MIGIRTQRRREDREELRLAGISCSLDMTQYSTHSLVEYDIEYGIFTFLPSQTQGAFLSFEHRSQEFLRGLIYLELVATPRIVT